MNNKLLVGMYCGVIMIAVAIPTYNDYILPYVRHKKIMSKLNQLEETEKSQK